MIKITEGQIWIEDDKRSLKRRYVKILEIRDPDVRIRTCDEDGAFVKGRSHGTWAQLKRFGKAGGYKLFKDA